MIVDFKISGIISAKEYNNLSFGQQLECAKQIRAFQDSAKTAHISQKRKSRTSAIKEFLKLNQVSQYYYRCEDSKYCRDDSFKIWYI